MKKVLTDGSIYFTTAPIPNHIPGYYQEIHNMNVFHPLETDCSKRVHVKQRRPCGKIASRFLCKHQAKAITVKECVTCPNKDNSLEVSLDLVEGAEKIDRVLKGEYRDL